jgi:holliday junction DNA helicase RuvA
MISLKWAHCTAHAPKRQGVVGLDKRRYNSRMIRTLTGRITAIGAMAVTIDVRGVGYLVHTATAHHSLSIETVATLHTYLAVRETALDLYGFLSEAELELFELLLDVPKIGPKSALQILAQANPTLLVESIGSKDSDRLHKLAGIGKKTAENLVQFLHEKIEGLTFTIPTSTPATSPAKADAIDALVSLGYDLTAARQTVQALGDELTVNELITKALKDLH